MKALFFTDTHLRQTNPRWRIGDYAEDVLAKIEATMHMATEEGVNAVFFGGDFVDHWNVALSIVNRAVDIIQYESEAAGFAFIMALGQHDVQGHNIETVWSSAASMLLRACSMWPTIKRGEIHYNDPDSTLVELKREKKSTVVVHAMIVPKPVPWPHILIEDIETDAQIVLSGDYHTGFPPTEHGGTWFANPGALARIAISDRDRVPQIAIIDTEKLPECPIEYVEIPHKPAEEAFDIVGYEAQKDVQAGQSEFVARLEQMAAGGHGSSWEALFEEVKESGTVDEDVLDAAYKLCKEVRE